MNDVFVIGLACIHGIWCGEVFRRLSVRCELRPLFDSVGSTWTSLLADDGNFVKEYFSLVLRVLRMLGWIALGLVIAIAPAALVWSLIDESLWRYITVSGIASLIWIVVVRLKAQNDDPQFTIGVDDSQFFFLQVARSIPGLVARADRFETWLLRRRLDRMPITSPVFVTGLARSGTTMILELLAKANGVATHRYRDFPFVATPWLWNAFYSVFGRSSSLLERAHQDGIQINADSPEAFEEVVWQRFFPFGADSPSVQDVASEEGHPVFESVFRSHIKKVLLVRRGTRYVSKGNYNIGRIGYLHRLFPDASFVVPIRHPASHVASLVRQHDLFCNYAEQDSRIAEYLTAAGHFEFGPQRCPVELDDSASETRDAWEAGDDVLGYAFEWLRVYGYVQNTLLKIPTLQDRLLVVRYEDFCSNPQDGLRKILTHVDLQTEGAEVLSAMGDIHAPNSVSDDDLIDKVWHVTQSVATDFGYARDPVSRLP